MMYKLFVLATLTVLSFWPAWSGDAIDEAASILSPDKASQTGFAGSFEAEGQYIETRFVRVLYAAEGSEREDGGASTEQLVFNSVDPQGNEVEVYRFQIVTKNTGYDELQTTPDGDFKLKAVENGAKIHLEIPVENGEMQLDKAYIGSLAYNFGTRETRNLLTPETVSDIELNVYQLDLPVFGDNHKPGDNGIIYNEGYLHFELSSKAKYINSDQIGDFNVSVDGVISITHVRGQERSNRAVVIDEGIVQRNV